jgi:hypothetical protein
MGCRKERIEWLQSLHLVGDIVDDASPDSRIAVRPRVDQQSPGENDPGDLLDAPSSAPSRAPETSTLSFIAAVFALL